MLPQIDNTKGVKVPWSPWSTRSLYDLFFSCSFIHGIVSEICLDIYRCLGQIPAYRKMLVDLFPKIPVFWYQVLLHLTNLLFYYEVLLQIEVIISALSLYLFKLLILFLQWDHVNRYVWYSQNHLSYSSCCAECRIYFRIDKKLEDLWFPNHIVKPL